MLRYYQYVTVLAQCEVPTMPNTLCSWRSKLALFTLSDGVTKLRGTILTTATQFVPSVTWNGKPDKQGDYKTWKLAQLGRGSSRTPNDLRPRRRRRFRRTSGKADRIPAAPSEVAPSGSNKTPAIALPAAASRAGSRVARSVNRARQTRAPAPKAPRSRLSGSLAVDDPASRST
jgi:hypothetical protein